MLVNNPSMTIADESTGNIDPAPSFETVGLLSEINHRGTTVLMVTHEHRLVKYSHRRVVEIHDGLVVVGSCNLASEVSDENWQCQVFTEGGYQERLGQPYDGLCLHWRSGGMPADDGSGHAVFDEPEHGHADAAKR